MTTAALFTMKIVVATLEQTSEGPLRLAFLGYPDITVPDDVFIQLFGTGALLRLVNRPNQDKIIQVHGAAARGVTRVPTVESVLALMTDRQVTVDVLDIATYHGSEIVCDMNYAVDEKLVRAYDMVWDGGTLEHVFDIAQGLTNCAQMCKLGGLVVHLLPINQCGHGFYNINPTLMVDFHEDNGFTTLLLRGLFDPWSADVFELPPSDRFRLDREASLLYAAQRTELTDRFVKPTQRRYRDPTIWK